MIWVGATFPKAGPEPGNLVNPAVTYLYGRGDFQRGKSDRATGRINQPTAEQDQQLRDLKAKVNDLRLPPRFEGQKRLSNRRIS